MRASGRLTALGISKITKPGRYADGLGLWLQVSSFGTKSWIFRFQRDGKARHMGLGPLHTISLAEARQKATECRKMLLDGLDPIEQRRSLRQRAKVNAARGVTFRECAERLIAAQEVGWRNAVHRQQWQNTLATYVFPLLGDLPVAAVDTALVIEVLEPIWTMKPETAARLRGRIEAVIDWAAARGYREGENPARWKGHLQNLLPARSKIARVRHHPALPYCELPTFMSELREREGVSARALEFAVLTAARTREVVGARWQEINLSGRTWIVPPERMKAGREHRVPLSDRAAEILESLPQEAEFVFVGDEPGRPLSNRAMLDQLKRMGRSAVTVHGFRSTFRDWAAEMTAYASEVVEMALAHAVKGTVEAAYRRGDLIEKRRRLMADWAGYCTSPPAEGGTVVPLRSADHG
jgi:integrase